ESRAHVTHAAGRVQHGLLDSAAFVFDSTPWTPKPNGQRQVTSAGGCASTIAGRFALHPKRSLACSGQGYMDSNSLSGSRADCLFDADRAEKFGDQKLMTVGGQSE
uniref:Ketoacyl_synth_N domain-containing protein n=1 Tax=Macrostomum lignano TaxID=282301 RepID=A0A1I8FCW7_9PLAT